MYFCHEESLTLTYKWFLFPWVSSQDRSILFICVEELKGKDPTLVTNKTLQKEMVQLQCYFG